jgi:group I intron endonuclease
MKYTVYLRTNKANGKQYVGQTNDFKRREFNWYNTNWHYAGRLIDNARKKYGVENWDTDILKECTTLEETNYWEAYYIKELNTKAPNGYNLTDGGDGAPACIVSDETRKKLSERTKGENNPFYGKHHSKETIEKLKNRVITDEWKKRISESCMGRVSNMKGKHLSDEAKQKLREAHLGKHLTDETKKKLSEANKGEKNWNYGKHLSEDTKKKISEANKVRFVGEKNPMYGKKRTDHPKRKTVYQYTLDGELVKIWNSPNECGENGFSASSVRNCCKGGVFQMYNGEKRWYKCTQHKGYKWSFEPL